MDDLIDTSIVTEEEQCITDEFDETDLLPTEPSWMEEMQAHIYYNQRRYELSNEAWLLSEDPDDW